MAIKFIRFNVRCTICNEVSLHDYTGRHAKSKHKELDDAGRTASATVVVEEDVNQRRMETFFQPKGRAYIAKKRKANKEKLESRTAVGASNHQSKKTRLEERDGVADVLSETAEKGWFKISCFLKCLKIAYTKCEFD